MDEPVRVPVTTAGKENEVESRLPVQQWVLSLRRRGISVLLIHHAGRNGEQRGRLLHPGAQLILFSE